MKVVSPSAVSTSDTILLVTEAELSPPFLTKGFPYRYPIYATFQHWKFPRTLVLQWWMGSEEHKAAEEVVIQPNSALTPAVLSRDKACVISGPREFIRAAHLCPRAGNDRSTCMSAYASCAEQLNDNSTNGPANASSLRDDIYRAVDGAFFVIVRRDMGGPLLKVDC
jgi:hypothetical protein